MLIYCQSAICIEVSITSKIFLHLSFSRSSKIRASRRHMISDHKLIVWFWSINLEGIERISFYISFERFSKIRMRWSADRHYQNFFACLLVSYTDSDVILSSARASKIALSCPSVSISRKMVHHCTFVNSSHTFSEFSQSFEFLV